MAAFGGRGREREIACLLRLSLWFHRAGVDPIFLKVSCSSCVSRSRLSLFALVGCSTSAVSEVLLGRFAAIWLFEVAWAVSGSDTNDGEVDDLNLASFGAPWTASASGSGDDYPEGEDDPESTESEPDSGIDSVIAPCARPQARGTRRSTWRIRHSQLSSSGRGTQSRFCSLHPASHSRAASSTIDQRPTHALTEPAPPPPALRRLTRRCI